jgi:LL-diaminopimelate aminotransferase
VPAATFYVWVPTPQGYDAMTTVMRILDEAAVVCIPGTGFGPAGEGYIRFALTVEVDRIETAIARMSEITWS